MKDFLKWLGVNEKVAKIVVWIFIGMIFLIMTNTLLESVGLPYYKLTAENLSKIKLYDWVEILIATIITILNFYASSLLIFSIKDSKKILPYAILFVIVSWVINTIFGYVPAQIAIFLFLILFAYYYSGKNKKYILYMIGSILINTIVQYLAYVFKIQFIDYTSLNRFNQFLLSIDYFLIMIVIIFLKEIINKKKNK